MDKCPDCGGKLIKKEDDAEIYKCKDCNVTLQVWSMFKCHECGGSIILTSSEPDVFKCIECGHINYDLSRTESTSNSDNNIEGGAIWAFIYLIMLIILIGYIIFAFFGWTSFNFIIFMIILFITIISYLAAR